MINQFNGGSKVKLEKYLSMKKNQNICEKQIMKVDYQKNDSNLEKMNESGKKKVDNRLKKYRVLHQIGKGSYAVVKLGLEKETGLKVAIKVYEKYKL